MSDEQIRERDGGRCARCGGSKGGLHVHHRQLRSAGTDERACNRVTLCVFCHSWAHHNPGQAIEEGWLVGRYADPATEEIQHWLWPATPILLESGGGIILVIPDG